MKSLKSPWKVCLGVVIGFTMGAWPFQTAAVNADTQMKGSVDVYIVPVTMPDATSPLPQKVSGKRVVGFPCVAKPTQKSPDAAVCYLATSPNAAVLTY